MNTKDILIKKINRKRKHDCIKNNCFTNDCCECYALLCEKSTFVLIDDDDMLRYCIKCLINYINNNNNKFKIKHYLKD